MVRFKMKLSSCKIFLLSSITLLINPLLFAKNTSDPSQTNRIPQFETDDVAVWKTTINPKDPLKMHRHDNKRIVVALTDVDLTVTNDQGGKSSAYHWPKGTAHLLEADKPGELHVDVNETDHPMEVMVIQFKK